MKPYDTILAELLAVVEQITKPTPGNKLHPKLPEEPGYCLHCCRPADICWCEHKKIRNLLSQLQAAKPPASPVIPLNDVCDVPPCDWTVHNPKKTLLNRTPRKLDRD